MRRLFTGLIMLALLGTTAYAQKSPPGPKQDDIDAAQRKREADAVDKQYKSTLERTKTDTAPVRTDPWASVRGTETPKR
jgi:hypothetical protein